MHGFLFSFGIERCVICIHGFLQSCNLFLCQPREVEALGYGQLFLPSRGKLEVVERTE